jgi:hypothetical protein
MTSVRTIGHTGDHPIITQQLQASHCYKKIVPFLAEALRSCVFGYLFIDTATL